MPMHQDKHPSAPPPRPHSPPSSELPPSLVADVQTTLAMAMTDLTRLKDLLDHATGNLLERFGSANLALAQAGDIHRDALQPVHHNLHQAVTDLQFHDLAVQLIEHTSKVLQNCAWKLDDNATALKEGQQPIRRQSTPERPSPVTQSEMHAGSIDLF